MNSFGKSLIAFCFLAFVYPSSWLWAENSGSSIALALQEQQIAEEELGRMGMRVRQKNELGSFEVVGFEPANSDDKHAVKRFLKKKLAVDLLKNPESTFSVNIYHDFDDPRLDEAARMDALNLAYELKNLAKKNTGKDLVGIEEEMMPQSFAEKQRFARDQLIHGRYRMSFALFRAYFTGLKTGAGATGASFWNLVVVPTKALFMPELLTIALVSGTLSGLIMYHSRYFYNWTTSGEMTQWLIQRFANPEKRSLFAKLLRSKGKSLHEGENWLRWGLTEVLFTGAVTAAIMATGIPVAGEGLMALFKSWGASLGLALVSQGYADIQMTHTAHRLESEGKLSKKKIRLVSDIGYLVVSAMAVSAFGMVMVGNGAHAAGDWAQAKFLYTLGGLQFGLIALKAGVHHYFNIRARKKTQEPGIFRRHEDKGLIVKITRLRSKCSQLLLE